MKSIDLTFPTPEGNLACDEALIEWCEQGHGEELLRFWESPEYFVVLGYSGKAASEVNLSACRRARVPVLRRCSGGGAVVQGPGCLNYSLILQIADRTALKGITETNGFVMRRHREVLESIVGAEIAVQGFTDLALGERKFSGISQHRKRRFLLFHGTLLLHFDIPRMDELLPLPLRQPAYRQNRSHGDFLTNLNAPASAIKEALKKSWNVTGPLEQLPLETIADLVERRYGREDWNFKF
ncbi:MAG: lipoate--protein ligase family protein [Candidatus Binatia bacterium]